MDCLHAAACEAFPLWWPTVHELGATLEYTEAETNQHDKVMVLQAVLYLTWPNFPTRHITHEKISDDHDNVTVPVAETRMTIGSLSLQNQHPATECLTTSRSTLSSWQ